MDSLNYTRLIDGLGSGCGVKVWPFSGSIVLDRVFASMLSTNESVVSGTAIDSDYALGFKTTARNWLAVFDIEPPTVDPVSRMPVETTSNRSGWFYFDDEVCRNIAMAAFSGRWGYLWWLLYGDEFDVTRGTLAAFPGDIKRLDSNAIQGGNHAAGDMKFESLVNLSKELLEGATDHLEFHLRGSGNRRVLVGRYDMSRMRHITDRADWLLAQAWGIEDAFDAAGNLRDRMVFGSR